jgi:hypothetical protein
MADEQQERFASMRSLVNQADKAVESMRRITTDHLTSVDNDAVAQAESLQRIQQYAGTAVDALRETAEIARHARSFQAQAHDKHSPHKPH